MHGCDKLTNTYAFRGGTGKLCACQFCTNRRKNVFFSQHGASYNTPRSYASGYLVPLLVDGHLLYHHDAVSACPRQQQGHLPVHQCPQGLESDIRGTQGGRDCSVSARTLRTEHPRNDTVKTNLQRPHLQDQKTVSSTISWSYEECGTWPQADQRRQHHPCGDYSLLQPVALALGQPHTGHSALYGAVS